MSIISIYETDNSDFTYKRFASVASAYLDEPLTKRSDTARVPLENIFRLLEMYRFNAFSDESRCGVLALDNVNPGPSEIEWHKKIKVALDLAVTSVYENLSRREKAVDEMEEALRHIAEGEQMENEMQLKAKKFFKKFCEELD